MGYSQPPQALVDYAREILLRVEAIRPGECAIGYDFPCHHRATINLHGKGVEGLQIPAAPRGITLFMDANAIVISQ